jgi:hypothetical protein
MGILDTAADVLQAPKNFLWGMIPGLHDDDTGQAYSGSQVAGNLFGTDPDSVWNKALGFGIDVAGDPLTWAAPLIGKGVGAAARGLGLMGDAAGAGASAAADAASSAYSPMKNLRNTFGMMTNMADVPGGLADATTSGLVDSGSLGRRVFQTPGGRMIGELSGAIDPEGALEAMKAVESPMASRRMGGAFLPFTPDTPGSTGMGFSTGPLSRRHEVVHGLINAASKGGDASGLPLSMRVPAWLQQPGSSSISQGLGEILNEAAAHSAESRTFGGQLGNYMNFLANPDPGYYSQVADHSPAVAAAWQSLPYATAGGLAAGTAAAAYPYMGN